MKRPVWLMIPAGAILLSVIAVWGAPDSGTTVGEFALKISHAMGQRPADQAAAASALAKAGVDLGKDMGARLSWDRVARILQGLGLKVAPPKEPAAQVSMAKAAQIVSYVAMSHGAGHVEFGRHHGKGCHASSSDPEDCDDDDDHGDGHGDDHGGDHHDGD